MARNFNWGGMPSINRPEGTSGRNFGPQCEDFGQRAIDRFNAAENEASGVSGFELLAESLNARTK